MTIGIVTVAVGDVYHNFLDGWSRSVQQLETPPDRVIIVTDRVSLPVLDASVACGATIVLASGSYTNHPQVLANEGIARLNTDWVCKLDADDRIYPHALNNVKETPADVLMFGVSVNGENNKVAPQVTAREVLTAGDNLLFAASPFRRWVWERSSGFQDLLYDDWLFWLEAARNEAIFLSSGTIDYEYQLHEHNSTRNVNHLAEKAKVYAHVH